MSDANQVPSGNTDQNPVGDDGQNPGATPPAKDSVQYATYQKVLGEKKKTSEELQQARERLAQYEAKEKAKHEESLQEQNKWKEWAESRENEWKSKFEETDSKLKAYEQKQDYNDKVSAVIGAMENGMDPKFHHLIRYDEIRRHPETGEIDSSAVQAEAERIRRDYPEIFHKPQNASFNPQAPIVNGNATLDSKTYARLNSTEKKQRINETNAPEWVKTGNPIG